MTTPSQEQLIRGLRDDFRTIHDKCIIEKKRLQMEIERTKSEIVDIHRRTEAARLAKQVAADQEALDASELAKYDEFHQNFSRIIKKSRSALANTKVAIDEEQAKSNVLSNSRSDVDITVNMMAMMELIQQTDCLLKEAETHTAETSSTDLGDKVQDKEQVALDLERRLLALKLEWDQCGFMGWKYEERNELLKTIYEETKALNKKYIMRRLELNTANRALHNLIIR